MHFEYYFGVDVDLGEMMVVDCCIGWDRDETNAGCIW